MVNDPLYNHVVFGPHKGKGGVIGKADDELIRDLVNIHNAENWLGMDGDSDLSMFKPLSRDLEEDKGERAGERAGELVSWRVYCLLTHVVRLRRPLTNFPFVVTGDDDDGDVSREPSPCGSCEDNPGHHPCLTSPLHNNNNNNNTTTQNNNNTSSSSCLSSSSSTNTTSASTSTSMSPVLTSLSSGSSTSIINNNNNNNKVTVATQTGQESPDLAFQQDKMTHDPHCYECKVRYRDPKPRDLIMYLHAWKFRVSIGR